MWPFEGHTQTVTIVMVTLSLMSRWFHLQMWQINTFYTLVYVGYGYTILIYLLYELTFKFYSIFSKNIQFAWKMFLKVRADEFLGDTAHWPHIYPASITCLALCSFQHHPLEQQTICSQDAHENLAWTFHPIIDMRATVSGSLTLCLLLCRASTGTYPSKRNQFSQYTNKANDS